MEINTIVSSLPAELAKNLAPVLPVLTPLQAGEELVSRTKGIKISQQRSDIDSKAEAEQERIGRIEGALRYAMLLVGIRAANLPNELETEVLTTFMARNYGNHTAEEIQLAFDMAVTGQFDIDSTAYENFSPHFLGKVMNAFRKWAAQEHRQKIRENEAKEPQGGEKNDNLVDWSDTWHRLIKQAKNGEIRKEFIPTDLYDWLDRTHYFLPVDASPDEKKAFNREKWVNIYECKAQYLSEMKTAMLRNQESGINVSKDIKHLITLMECYEADLDGVILDENPWKKNEVIMSTVTVMAKQRMVFKAAVMEAQNL